MVDADVCERAGSEFSTFLDMCFQLSLLTEECTVLYADCRVWSIYSGDEHEQLRQQHTHTFSALNPPHSTGRISSHLISSSLLPTIVLHRSIHLNFQVRNIQKLEHSSARKAVRTLSASHHLISIAKTPLSQLIPLATTLKHTRHDRSVNHQQHCLALFLRAITATLTPPHYGEIFMSSG
jgi:hypothetical protein